MTGDYAIILPLMISNVISYTVAAWFQPVPIYDALLLQDGVPLPDHETHRDLRSMTVDQAMRPVDAASRSGEPVLYPDQTLDHALLTLGRQAIREAAVARRDAPDIVVGLLSLEDISAALNRVT
jgi:hypothetical protein